MKVNSGHGISLGRQALKEHGDSWAKVREAGVKRDDGVIVVKRAKDATPNPAPRKK